MIDADRLRERMTAVSLSQSELARRVGVSQTTIYKILTGDALGSKHLHLIARELGTTPAYLTGETADPAEGAVPLPTPETIAEQLDLVPIAIIDLEYGLGATFVDDHVEVEVGHFPRVWVNSFTSTPSTLLTFARGRGDSMMPTIHSNDMVMIDRSQRVIEEPDAIWAYSIGNMGGIKRLRVRGERVTILSDNPAVPPDEAMTEEMTIIGRVIMIIRSI
ncbi:XRE family transcriptional regulator [Sphingomonas oligophenolica]|nr:S24 family peptidase [Sphingomonas oligophenolica]